MPPPPASYDSWTKEELIARLRQLERSSQSPSHISRDSKQKEFDFSAHPRRKIALKFCYNGSEYCGLEHQKGYTPLPSVEGVLFDALSHVRLIDPKGGFEGCGWEKCGRTDKGVSGAQQVVSLWVRSALQIDHARNITQGPSSSDNQLPPSTTGEDHTARDVVAVIPKQLDGDFDLMGDWDEPPSNTGRPLEVPQTQELKYVSSINNILPPSIRVIAWSPVSPDFSARFNCQYRHYKYFFTTKEDGLDVTSMQDAADRLLGEHDFRNLCKVDPAKQLTSFRRRILRAEINPVDESRGLYVFDLKGTAFLYNQVRHILAILFLVGTQLEHPSVMSALLNVDPQNPYPPFREGEHAPEVVETKPEYQMASGLPLVLWECGYSDTDVQWRTDRTPSIVDQSTTPAKPLSQRELSSNLHAQLSSIHTNSLIMTTLYSHFLLAARQYHSPPPSYFPRNIPDALPISDATVLSVPLGGGTYRKGARYVKLLERKRGEDVQAVNERWREGKGKRRAERLEAERNRIVEE
ncbi:hypothetical protein NLI96_g4266 [Meripilus lineatus]|uniref:Pseudouridine synthase I TruA alpha/beta domain-containing protein n=1 Tax=Meripilus lineatus TaxID=2056292 RepID=A0AAD5YEY5_9APHY|nr:hypothetical protein NLI96_g4266 [Physisporinus lineatus]